MIDLPTDNAEVMTVAATPAELLDAFDGGMARHDAAAVAQTFSDHAELLLLYEEKPLSGRPAILEFWRRFFDEFETTDWTMSARRVDIHGTCAYVLADYTETFRPRVGGPGTRVVGRIVLFLSAAAGSWHIDLALNAHSRPAETVG